MLQYENSLKKQGVTAVIGIDEAGRGPLAGPVVAGAAVIGDFAFTSRIDDSKKLTPLQREKAFAEITAVCVYGIGIIGEALIDKLNIRNATRLAMEQAATALIGKLSVQAKERIHILVDGDMALTLGYPCTAIVRGDAISKSIAAGSILAKVTRDRLMVSYDAVYPAYGFVKHKGYPTRQHRQALAKYGPTPIHRKSFCGVG